MQSRSEPWLAAAILTSLAIVSCSDNSLEPAKEAASPAALAAASVVAAMYAPDFVATAATGYDLNDAGDVVGRSRTDPGCGSFCLPPEEIVVWRGGNRIVLPQVAGQSSSYQFPLFINNQGLIAAGRSLG